MKYHVKLIHDAMWCFFYYFRKSHKGWLLKFNLYLNEDRMVCGGKK